MSGTMTPDQFAEWLAVRFWAKNCGDKETCRAKADSLRDNLTAAGLAVVPVEPTGDTQCAGGEAQQRSIGSWGEPGVVWRAMIRAANLLQQERG